MNKISQELLTLRSCAGRGRTFILIAESAEYQGLIAPLAAALQERSKVIWLETGRVAADTWARLAEALRNFVETENIRQASFVAFGASSAVVQNFYLHEPRQVRTMVFVDAATRPHPTSWHRLADSIEHALPLGLPLRLTTKDFDVKPFLQRLRTPVLIITTARASVFLRHEAEIMHQSIPTAWAEDISQHENPALELCRLISDFQGVLAKCPQKNQVQAAS